MTNPNRAKCADCPRRTTRGAVRCRECERLKKREVDRRSPIGRCLRDARSRAQLKGWAFDIDAPYLLQVLTEQGGRCYFFGIPLSTGADHAGSPSRISIDRIDGRRGYVRGNVILTSQAANLGRNVHSVRAFAKFAREIKATCGSSAAQDSMRATCHANVRSLMITGPIDDVEPIEAQIMRMHPGRVRGVSAAPIRSVVCLLSHEAADALLKQLAHAPRITAMDNTGACNA